MRAKLPGEAKGLTQQRTLVLDNTEPESFVRPEPRDSAILLVGDLYSLLRYGRFRGGSIDLTRATFEAAVQSAGEGSYNNELYRQYDHVQVGFSDELELVWMSVHLWPEHDSFIAEACRVLELPEDWSQFLQRFLLDGFDAAADYTEQNAQGFVNREDGNIELFGPESVMLVFDVRRRFDRLVVVCPSRWRRDGPPSVARTWAMREASWSGERDPWDIDDE